jgi:hypothetical protein
MSWLRRRRAERALREAEEAKALSLEPVTVVDSANRPDVENDGAHLPPSIEMTSEPLVITSISPSPPIGKDNAVLTPPVASVPDPPEEEETSSDTGERWSGAILFFPFRFRD